MAAHEEKQARRRAGFRRRLRSSAALLALLLVLGTAAIVWLLASRSGLEFALARVTAASNGQLQVDRADGRLAGPLSVHGLHYRTADGLRVEIRQATIDIALWPLLSRTLRIDQLAVDGVRLRLPGPAAAGADADEPAAPLSLQPPLQLDLRQLKLSDFKLSNADGELLRVDSLALAGAWTDHGLRLDQLALHSPDGNVRARATLQGAGGTNGQAAFAWSLGGLRLAGDLSLSSEGKTVSARLQLNQPLPATLTARVQPREAWPWTVHAEVPHSELTHLPALASLGSLALDLQATGDRDQASASGTLSLHGWPLRLADLRVARRPDGGVQLEQATLRSPRIPGELSVKGDWHAGDDPAQGALHLAWQGVQLPAELAGQALASQGELSLRGGAAGYQAHGELQIGPPGKLATMQLVVHGDAERVLLDQLSVLQPDGRAEISGQLDLAPQPAWDLRAKGQGFDPGQILADWPGRLDFDLASQGRGGPNLQGDLRIERLAGSLRGHDISGRGALRLSAGRVLAGDLRVAAGSSSLVVRAADGADNDIRAELHLSALQDWLSGAKGSLRGELRLRGPLADPSLSAELAGQDLTLGALSAGQLELQADLGKLLQPQGELQMDARQLQAGPLGFASFQLQARGDGPAHQLTLDAEGEALDVKLEASGQLHDQRWQAELARLDVSPQGVPAWHLAEPVKLLADAGRMTLSRLCLQSGQPHLCIEGGGDPRQGWQAAWQLQALPLALLSTAIPAESMPVAVSGALSGQGQLRVAADGEISGQASLSSAEGALTWLDNPSRPLLAWQALALEATLADGGGQLVVQAGLSGQGRLDGHASFAGPGHTLQGQLALHLPSLALVELLTPALAAVYGSLDARFDLAGTLAAPRVLGQAQVHDLAAEVPALGLKLHAGALGLHSDEQGRLLLQGQVRSGEGVLKLAGQVDSGAAAAVQVAVTGEAFEAVNLPAAQVALSPALTIQRDAEGLRLAGTVAIDRAQVDLGKLPGGGVTSASPDVVIVDAPQQAPEDGVPIHANLYIDMGSDTHLRGFGLLGDLHGALAINQRPGHAPLGRGRIEVDGSYRAYGQDLQIEDGQLLFASTPLDNPGLDIRAVRKLNPNATIDQGQAVGLQISGTAQQPVLTVFSNPVMAQSDALSYLVTGKPLSSLKGGEGNLVSSAAQAMGSAVGDMLAGSIGSKLGLDVGVSSNTALGGAAAFTVGKYLSPRLYLNYGVGLFDPGTVVTLRYIFSPHWNFEATQATEFSRAALNYRFER